MICPLCHQEKWGALDCKVCGAKFCIDCGLVHEESCGMYEVAAGPMEMRPYQKECVSRIMQELQRGSDC